VRACVRACVRSLRSVRASHRMSAEGEWRQASGARGLTPMECCEIYASTSAKRALAQVNRFTPQVDPTLTQTASPLVRLGC
jgi:hypothetical protein